jgi:hypothetical protein
MRLPFTTIVAFFLTVLGAPAAVLDWGAVTWTAGTLSNTYSNVQGSGVDVKVAFSGNTSTLLTTPPPAYPNTSALPFIGGTGKPSLQADAQFLSSSSITVTITFSKAVYVQNLNILDVDESAGAGGWQDVISQIKGTTSSGTINPVSVVGGTAVSVTGGPSAWKATGIANSVSDSTGNVSVNFGNSPVTQITFVWTPGSGAPNPQPQRIGLDNITFSLTPEVGPSLAAMTLCGLVVLAQMRAGKKKKRSKAPA